MSPVIKRRTSGARWKRSRTKKALARGNRTTPPVFDVTIIRADGTVEVVPGGKR